MISTNPFNPVERQNKLNAPSSPQAKRKNIDFALYPTPDYLRKDSNNVALSPQTHFYAQKQGSGKSIDVSNEREMGLELMIREVSDRVIKMSHKLAQHQSILIKMTENSIESNKQEVKRGNQVPRAEYAKITEALTQNMSKLRKDFEDYKSGHLLNRQIEVKNQLFSELIHKSQERMRQEIFELFRNKESITSTQEGEQLERAIKKLQKNVSANSNKLGNAFERIESISASIDGHMDLVNAEVNKGIAKIVSFVNEKVSRPLSEAISNLGEKTDNLSQKYEHFTEKILKLDQKNQLFQNRMQSIQSSVGQHFGGLKSSKQRSVKQYTRAQYRQTLSAFDQEIIISEKMYHIDSEGFLLDRELYYLTGRQGERIRLDQRQIRLLVSQEMLE